MLLLFSSSWHGTFLSSSSSSSSSPLTIIRTSLIFCLSLLLYLSNYLLFSSAQMMVAGNIPSTPSMDVAPPPPPPPPQQSLRCPRCDSSNTKFCYYNNYSLSQPRHFCKACKRYWTRGGTLRNVPVGGGCRKNKKVKKPTSSSSSSSVAALSLPPRHSLPAPPHLSLPTNGAVDFNPLLFGFTSAASSSPSDVNLPSLPAFLGYPDNHEHNEYHRLSLCDDLSHPLQQSSVLDNYPLLGSSLSTALLVSSLKQPKKVQEYQAMLPYHDLQQNVVEGDMGLGPLKDVKVEDDALRVHCGGDSLETMPLDAPGDDPASSNFYWNSSITAWPDPASFGSSLAPLI